jgi:two-component system cell cycle sensor histidine kinase/response regulator CckA
MPGSFAMAPPKSTEFERPTILLIEDDAAHAELASRALEPDVVADVHTVGSLEAARAWLGQQAADLILADLRLPDGSALELLGPGMPLVILTSQGDEARAVAAMKGGALDYVVKSPDLYRDMPVLVERALRAANSERSRLRAEAALKESEARFQQLAASLEEAFWLYDVASDRIVYASPAWRTVYGVPFIANQSADARLGAVHREDADRVRGHFQDEVRKVAAELEYRVSDAGRVRWIHERTFPIRDSSGQCVRVTGMGADVTKRRELESVVRQAQKMEAIGQLAGGVAHDFNNMLTPILSAGEELLENAQSPVERELCSMIISASERAAELTHKLLSFSRKGRTQNAAVDMHAVIRDTVALLERSIDRRVRILIELHAAASTVMGDVAQLQNVLLNLGINARDAMPDGGELHFRSEVLDLDATSCAVLPFELRPGLFLQLSVRDTGTGIPIEMQSRIFEPFYTSKELGKGTGLGLAAVYGTMLEHNGAVTVESQPGLGAVFRLLLPLSNEALPSKEVSRPLVQDSGLILLVDDEPLVLAAGTQLLKSLGFTVVAASDGDQALQRFHELSKLLVAVICDVVMPRMSGSELVRELRAIDASVPIVVASGFPRNERPSLGVASPGRADAFLAKPFHRNELSRTLSSVIRPKLAREPS